MTDSGRLAGRVAWISGGGSGIGRESALRFAAEGARVLVADCDETAGAATVAEVAAAGGGSLDRLRANASRQDASTTMARGATAIASSASRRPTPPLVRNSR